MPFQNNNESNSNSSKNFGNREAEMNNNKENRLKKTMSDADPTKELYNELAEEFTDRLLTTQEKVKQLLKERIQKIEVLTQEDENNEIIANNPQYFYKTVILPKNYDVFEGGVINSKWINCSYRYGFFPWYDKYSPITWHRPQYRAVFYIKDITFGRTIHKLIKHTSYEIWVNRNKEQTVKNCALPRIKEPDTWINQRIINVYPKLPNFLSVEVYNQDKLVGGLYGLIVGGTFCGESMFNLESNTAKIAFFSLCQICLENDIELIDSQVLNDFTKSLGAIEITNSKYQKHLQQHIDQAISEDIYLTRKINLNYNFFKKS